MQLSKLLYIKKNKQYIKFGWPLKHKGVKNLYGFLEVMKKIKQEKSKFREVGCIE